MLPLADPFGDYVIEIDAPARLLLETFHGAKKVVSALMSDRCFNCDKTTEQGFDLLSCSRAYMACWDCQDRGPRGLDSASVFALSTVSFAATHFLVSDKELKASGLMVLEVDDPTKANGLELARLSVVQVNSAKALGEDKFGGKAGLAAEKTRRAEKSEAAYEAKLKAATPGAKLPALPDMVRKEREKASPQHSNYVCLNQRSSQMFKVCEKYGFHYVRVRGPNSLSRPPSVVVSNDPVESVLAAYPTLAGPSSVFTNLVEAVSACEDGATLIIDAEVDLPKAIRACDKKRCQDVLNGERQLTIGGKVQKNVLFVGKDLKIVGTRRGAIFSNSAVLWAGGGHLSLECVALG